MEPDKYQQAWQAQATLTRVTVDADVLRQAVQVSQQSFRQTIIGRDVREILVALLMIPLWFFMGAIIPVPWTWYLTVPALLWMAGFMLVYRIRHPQRLSEPDAPLLAWVKNSFTQVEDQIWLLRNVLWWYLLPPGISIAVFFLHVAWQFGVATSVWPAALLMWMFSWAFLFGLYYYIYELNQSAVRTQLEPQRQELLALVRSLEDETTGEISGDYPMLMKAERVKYSPWRILIAAVCFVLILGVGVPAILRFAKYLGEEEPQKSNYEGPPQSSGPGGDSLASLVTKLCKEKELVGLAAMVMVDGDVQAAAAVGERKIGSGVPVETSDRWHLGGIAKSITATMIARLIESGQMQWSDTIGDVFHEAPVHEDWKPVTLNLLLTDTAGAPANFPIEVLRQRPPLGPECTEARREAVLDVVAEEPTYLPGTKYEYSNVGYAIAAAMAEKVTGATWEDLVQREVFKPLALSESGFGPPKSADEALEQPRGHRSVPDGKVAADEDADNSAIMAPSGIVHMSLDDLCRYAAEHLRGELGEGKLLSSETYEKLHAPELEGYACGWVKREASADIPYTSYWHNGSNTLWYALVVFIPEKNTVVAVTSNDGDSVQAEAAAWEIVAAALRGEQPQE